MVQKSETCSPYPGLRPFQEFDAAYFYGRQEQVAEVISRLRKTQFVAVLGGSGSGKSSLILAGVIPELRTYALAEAGDFWVPVTTTPGTNHAAGQSPVLRLARKFCALLQPLEEHEAERRIASCADILRRKDGFAELVGQYSPQLADTGALDPRQANFLFLIDQFEEMFHPSNQDIDDCGILVERVLDNFRRPHAQVCVVITMRTEHLSDCARYLELPDAINAASYLVRRLDADQIRESIEKPSLRYLRLLARHSRRRQRREGASAQAPAELPGDCSFDQEVSDRLLRDAEQLCGNPDHLPLLQHLLFRLWQASTMRAQRAGLEVPASIGAEEFRRAVCADHDSETCPALPDEENCLQLCLENWAQRLYRAEPEKHAKLERVFRALAFKEPNSRTYTQRRVGFDELIALLDLEDEAALQALLHSWLSPHCYLYWDTESRTIKVAHESFIRGWSEFHRWIDEDDERFQEYVRLLAECQRWEQKGRNNAELIEGARLKRVDDVKLREALDDAQSVRHFEHLLELHRDGATLKPFTPSVHEFLQCSTARHERRETAQAAHEEQERLREEQIRQQRHEQEKQALRARARQALGLATIAVVAILGVLLAAESTLGEKERLLHRAFAIASESQVSNDGQFRSMDSQQLPLRNLLVGVSHYERGTKIALGPMTRASSRLTLRGERIDGIERTTMIADTRSASALQAVLGETFWPVERDDSHRKAITSASDASLACKLVPESSTVSGSRAVKSTPGRFFAHKKIPSVGLVATGGKDKPIQLFLGTYEGGKCRGILLLSLPPPLLLGTRVAFDADMRYLLIGLASKEDPGRAVPDSVEKWEIAWPENVGDEANAKPRGVVKDPELARDLWPEGSDWIVRLRSVARETEHATDVLVGKQWLRIFSTAPRKAEFLDVSFNESLAVAPANGQCAKLDAVIRERAATGKIAGMRPGVDQSGEQGEPQPYRMFEHRTGAESLCVSVARREPQAAEPLASTGTLDGDIDFDRRYVVSVYRFAKDMPVENKRLPVMRGVDFRVGEPKEIRIAGAGDFNGWLAVRGDEGSGWAVAPWKLAAWKQLACQVFQQSIADKQPDFEKFGPGFDLIRKPGNETEQTKIDEGKLCDGVNGSAVAAAKSAYSIVAR